MAETSTITLIGPEHNGLPMSLDEFAHVEGQGGYLYELDKGTIVVVDVPGLPHGRKVQLIIETLSRYNAQHPGTIDYIAGGGEAAMRMPYLQSERHPDVSIYLTPPPVEGPQPWEFWSPDIVVEIVTFGSEDRDYVIKRDEYLKAGVKLYWIIDPQESVALVLLRKGDTWQEQRLGETDKLATPLLPGFELPLVKLFSLTK